MIREELINQGIRRLLGESSAGEKSSAGEDDVITLHTKTITILKTLELYPSHTKTIIIAKTMLPNRFDGKTYKYISSSKNDIYFGTDDDGARWGISVMMWRLKGSGGLRHLTTNMVKWPRIPN